MIIYFYFVLIDLINDYKKVILIIIIMHDVFYENH